MRAQILGDLVVYLFIIMKNTMTHMENRLTNGCNATESKHGLWYIRRVNMDCGTYGG